MDSREQQMENGRAVARFLNDPTIRSVFAETEQVYFRMWISSDSPAEREALWAKARAMQELGVTFQAVVDAGTLAARQEEQARRPQL